jgi:ATP-dependent DNA ligase
MKPMLCKKADPDRVAAFPSIYVEYKLDGIRVLAHVDLPNKKVSFTSRGGNEFPSIQHLAEPVMAFAEHLYGSDACLVLDGEVISGSFNDTVSQVRKLRKSATDAVYHIFDHLTKAEWDAGRSEDYLDVRRHHLDEAFYRYRQHATVKHKDNITVTHCGQNVTQDAIDEMYEHSIKVGLEGLIVKNAKSHYICNKRSNHWLKMKAEDTLDLPIIAVIKGGGKYAHCMGAVVVLHNNVEVNVGTGFDDKDREAIWNLYESNPEDIIGRLIEVRYQYETPAGSLRHPSFFRFRDDK